MRLESRKPWAVPVAISAILFGIATVGASGLVLSGHADGGRVVPFVLWFNFVAGFFYVGAGVGLLGARPWAPRLSAVIAVASGLVGVAFVVHVALGGSFELRTVVAMSLRCAFWTAVAWSSLRAPVREVDRA